MHNYAGTHSLRSKRFGVIARIQVRIIYHPSVPNRSTLDGLFVPEIFVLRHPCPRKTAPPIDKILSLYIIILCVNVLVRYRNINKILLYTSLFCRFAIFPALLLWLVHTIHYMTLCACINISKNGTESQIIVNCIKLCGWIFAIVCIFVSRFAVDTHFVLHNKVWSL